MNAATAAPRSALWRYIEERLDGRSWNWLGRQFDRFDDGSVTGVSVRNWAEGRYPLKRFRAVQLAEIIDGDADEIMRLAAEAQGAEEPPPGFTRERFLWILRDSDMAGANLDALTTEQLGQLVTILGVEKLVIAANEPNGANGKGHK